MTKSEKDTIAKLMLMIANLTDENRKEVAYDPNGPRPEFTIEELRPTCAEAMAEAQVILSREGY